MVLRSIILVILVIFCIVTLSHVSKLDISMIKYVSNNHCSTGVLDYSLQEVVKAYHNTRALAGVSIFIYVVCGIYGDIVILMFAGYYKPLLNCFGIRHEEDEIVNL